MSRIFLFSGQGSQYVGMSKDLCESFDVARNVIERADAQLGYALSEIMWNGPAEVLRETRYTQPALFVHEAAMLSVIADRSECNAVAGHSLGEFSALYCAKVLSFEDALRLVALRAQLMFDAGSQQPGTMAAVVGMADEKVEEICASITSGVVVPANYNSPGQVVISGDAEAVRASLPLFKDAGARMVTELQVSGAFHSSLMKPAQEELARAIHATTFQDADKDVYCNVDAAVHRAGSELKECLIAQLVRPVRWSQSLMSMHANGITEYVEVGPGKVLQGLVKRTLQGVNIQGFDTAVDVQAL